MNFLAVRSPLRFLKICYGCMFSMEANTNKVIFLGKYVLHFRPFNWDVTKVRYRIWNVEITSQTVSDGSEKFVSVRGCIRTCDEKSIRKHLMLPEGTSLTHPINTTLWISALNVFNEVLKEPTQRRIFIHSFR